ncbi:4Fe-4S dicluster domain-containing protein [Thiohalobacter sp. IOR34]|uniref:sulfate reduction electron transfer complex DsrMKJOP subunit DsrO n=1 Tax=Thiohalobacter sp. IOR34 TaxID=3057176 RepID=UPI0025B09AA4|nr:4Fe-4S dicluster domain-containing protein [Thiohalobacter sp. IOR34]WJW74351.1 4Fe-4S dicluster domain-containing protein [Thiohalobacter sp. IOR34]
MSSTTDTNTSRRRFLGTAAGAAGVAVAPGVFLTTVAQARPAEQPASSENRWGMLIDTNKCASGCDACVSGCQKENGWGGPNSNEKHSSELQKAQWIRKVDIRDKQTGFSRSLPMMCQHCEFPPCVDVCPTGASMKRADGIVLVDRHICIGCRYCMMACPYKARSFIHEELHDQLPTAPRGKGTVESCTLCVHRVDRDGGNAVPACAEACAAAGHDAFVFGDLNDPNSRISQELAKHGGTQIRADLGLNVGIRYRGI